MPNVPNVPGVPTLSSYGIQDFVLLAADAILAPFGIFGPSQWGIFLDGSPVITADNTVTFDFKEDWPQSDYQLEQGAFESYDKVTLPFDVRVRMSAGGSEANRTAFINSVLAIAPGLDLLDVVTPEQVFTSCNIGHIDWHRGADRGMGLVSIDIWLRQINESAQASFGPTQQPSSASPVGAGNVQPTTPSQIIQQDFSQFN